MAESLRQLSSTPSSVRITSPAWPAVLTMIRPSLSEPRRTYSPGLLMVTTRPLTATPLARVSALSPLRVISAPPGASGAAVSAAGAALSAGEPEGVCPKQPDREISRAIISRYRTVFFIVMLLFVLVDRAPAQPSQSENQVCRSSSLKRRQSLKDLAA